MQTLQRRIFEWNSLEFRVKCWHWRGHLNLFTRNLDSEDNFLRNHLQLSTCPNQALNLSGGAEQQHSDAYQKFLGEVCWLPGQSRNNIKNASAAQNSRFVDCLKTGAARLPMDTIPGTADTLIGWWTLGSYCCGCAPIPFSICLWSLALWDHTMKPGNCYMHPHHAYNIPVFHHFPTCYQCYPKLLPTTCLYGASFPTIAPPRRARTFAT